MTESVTKDQLVQGLQDDLAREYKAIIQYVIYSQKLDEARYMDIAEQLEQHAHQEQDHQIDLATALGVTPDPEKLQGQGPATG